MQGDDDDERHEMTWVIFYCDDVIRSLKPLVWGTAPNIVKVFNGHNSNLCTSYVSIVYQPVG